MLRPEDVETILTTHDLSMYLKDMVEKEDSDLKIDIDYESGELFINCPGFSQGLSVKTDPFGVWVISEVVSQKNKGIFTRPENFTRPKRP
jgi:frataxin-like iron-binding protein CyaY